MNSSFNQWAQKLKEAIDLISCTEGLQSIPSDLFFQKLTNATIESADQKVFLIGNGASSSMASHIAADLCKNGKVATRCFTDASLLTALANDIGVEEMFAEPLRRQASKGDILVCISSSGKSPNILRAVDVAKEKQLYVVTLSSMSPENPLRKLGNLNAYIPADTYGFAETAHAAILHYWVDCVIDQITPDK